MNKNTTNVLRRGKHAKIAEKKLDKGGNYNE